MHNISKLIEAANYTQASHDPQWVEAINSYGPWFPSLLVSDPLDANGFSRSNIMLMEQSSATKLVSSPKVTLNVGVSITKTLLLWLPN